MQAIDLVHITNCWEKMGKEVVLEVHVIGVASAGWLMEYFNTRESIETFNTRE